MGVIRTDRWLKQSYDKPIELCKKLENYFRGASSSEIFEHLTFHGMYRRPSTNSDAILKQFQEKRIWNTLQKEMQDLKNRWQGPDVPVFVLPVDETNRKIKSEFHGMSGLSFKDKVFLFLSPNHTEKEMKALFTHEYNHVCRLHHYKKLEKDYQLLDAIILEGLAENAVMDRLGEGYVANWTSYYDDYQLKKFWERIILPNKNIPNSNPKHQPILYGLKLYPKMLGYCVGYYLVRNYLQVTKQNIEDIMHLSSETIAQTK